ncbi:MAG TPA: ABC transporter ATP-binding protein [Candidatus Paceibacterota bacterium]
MQVISVRDLTKEYTDTDPPTRVLKGISFTIEQGSFVSIMGPSGSGKSTLLHLLSFLDRPTAGTYEFNGRDVTTLTDEDFARIRNEEIGFVFQSFNLLSRSSVYENVEMPLLYAEKVPATERKARIEEAIASVGLSEKLNLPAGKLSGGQKQRVAIARALVNKPSVIFADEPTGNLDSESGAQVMDILDDLNNAGHTIVLVTHETYTAEFADRIIRIKDGTVESDAPIITRRNSKNAFFK